MAWITDRLFIASEIDPSDTIAHTHVIPDGKRFEITGFCGHAAHTVNSVVKIVWDYDTENEMLIWATKGEAHEPLYFECVGDGIKKMAVVLENGEAGKIIMSGGICYNEEL